MENVIFWAAFVGFICYICATADNKRFMRMVGGAAVAVVFVVYLFASAAGGYHDPDASCNPVVSYC